jgi:choline kinase
VSEVRAPAVHVVVLAAGRGSRLGALGGETPKWLLPVGGRRIADRHLQGFAAAGGQVASVRVVTGHAAPAIEAFLAEREAAPAIAVVENPTSRTSTTGGPCCSRCGTCPRTGPVVVLNGDLLTDPAWVSDFIADVLAGTEEASWRSTPSAGSRTSP